MFMGYAHDDGGKDDTQRAHHQRTLVNCDLLWLSFSSILSEALRRELIRWKETTSNVSCDYYCSIFQRTVMNTVSAICVSITLH